MFCSKHGYILLIFVHFEIVFEIDLKRFLGVNSIWECKIDPKTQPRYVKASEKEGWFINSVLEYDKERPDDEMMKLGAPYPDKSKLNAVKVPVVAASDESKDDKTSTDNSTKGQVNSGATRLVNPKMHSMKATLQLTTEYHHKKLEKLANRPALKKELKHCISSYFA